LPCGKYPASDQLGQVDHSFGAAIEPKAKAIIRKCVRFDNPVHHD